MLCEVCEAVLQSVDYCFKCGTDALNPEDPYDMDVVTCSGCGAYRGVSSFKKEHIRDNEPCGIFL